MEYVFSFLIGGTICAIGQILLDTTQLTMPRILVIFVVSGILLESIHLYEPLVRLGHQGATIPLTGFGYALAKGAMNGAKNGLLGAITGALKDTSAGVAVAVSFGYFVAMIFSPKSGK